MNKGGELLEKAISQIEEIHNVLEVSDQALMQVSDEINYRLKAYRNISDKIEGEEEKIALESAINELESLVDFMKYRLFSQFSSTKK